MFILQKILSSREHFEGEEHETLPLAFVLDNV